MVSSQNMYCMRPLFSDLICSWENIRFPEASQLSPLTMDAQCKTGTVSIYSSGTEHIGHGWRGPTPTGRVPLPGTGCGPFSLQEKRSWGSFLVLSVCAALTSEDRANNQWGSLQWLWREEGSAEWAGCLRWGLCYGKRRDGDLRGSLWKHQYLK